MADKESKMREMKRQNLQLKSKIKFLEEETENLNDKIDSTLKERNKLRKELQINLTTPSLTLDYLDTTTGTSNKRETTSDPSDGSFNLSYWNDMNTSSSWDVNYNTGNIHKYNISNYKDSNGIQNSVYITNFNSEQTKIV